MISATARIVIGLPMAILVPLSISEIRQSRRLTIIASAFLIAYAFYTLPFKFTYVPIAAIAILATISTRRIVDDIDPLNAAPLATKLSWVKIRPRGRLAIPLIAPVLVAAVAAFSISDKRSDMPRALHQVLLDNDLAVIIFGGLATIFAGGLFVGYLVHPLAARIPKASSADGTADGSATVRLLEAGTHIGWVERALFFIFFVGGSPEAAALALAAKSFVRAPTPQSGNDSKAEYYLMGSLASVAVSLTTAVTVRLMLGRSAI